MAVYQSASSFLTMCLLSFSPNYSFFSGREYTPRIGVIITDGRSHYPGSTKTAAARAKGENVFLVSVGIAGYQLSELVDIATPPASKNVFEVTDWSKLVQSVNKLANTTCEGEFTQAYQLSIFYLCLSLYGK